ncbi:hypothetical protein OUZ56_005391 [Daphnia magna]|uniref:Uncharacterized protein n=1 Tax=Daphnia magna TaxID=35525 RepID=A0ABQ9YSQ2_9CRUS|nr:hypothetical protein OUZ56_005391 [Daphnia magna]
MAINSFQNELIADQTKKIDRSASLTNLTLEQNKWTNVSNWTKFGAVGDTYVRKYGKSDAARKRLITKITKTLPEVLYNLFGVEILVTV